MNSDQFRKAGHAAIEDIINYFKSLPDRRVTPSISPGYLAPQLPSSAPISSEPWSAIQSDISSKIIPGLTHWQSPKFMAFYPANVTYPSILGELYSAAFNAPAFNWLCSPACTELETVVLDWVARMIGLPETFLSTSAGGGVIQGSASEAVVVAMIAARERLVRSQLEKEGLIEQPNESPEQELAREDRSAELRSKMVALSSEQAHSSAQKAANILGVRSRSLRAGAATGFRITGDTLREKLETCKTQGLHPFFLTVTMGTTGTCAIDAFDEIAAVLKDYPEIWVHVDAAYAGSALICEEYREQLLAKWVGHFDSLNFNMHKWLMVNFDASCFFVRSRLDLTAALSIAPSYLVNPASISGLVTDYRDWQIPLGRRFRALKIWFVLRTYGVKGLQDIIRNHVALGERFADLVKTRPDLFEIVAGPTFALTVLKCRLPSNSIKSPVNVQGAVNPDSEMNGFGTNSQDGSVEKQASKLAAENALTKQVSELINARGEIFLTHAVADGVGVIRIVSASERAEEKYLKRAFEILVETTQEVLAAQT